MNFISSGAVHLVNGIPADSLFNDKIATQKIMSAQHPKEQKFIGRKIQHFDDTIWTQKREQIVYKGNYEKFTQNSKLLGKLIETAPHHNSRNQSC